MNLSSLRDLQDSLLSILSSLLVPCGIDNSEDISKLIISGQIYGSAMVG